MEATGLSSTGTGSADAPGSSQAPIVIDDTPTFAAAASHKRPSTSGPSSVHMSKKPHAAVPPWPNRKSLQNIEWEEIPRPPWQILEDDEPDWPTQNPDGTDCMYYVTKKGFAGYEEMCDQAWDRDSDEQGEFGLGSHFSGYGQVEVLENAIALWEKEWRKKNRHAEDLWFRMEAIALWINKGEVAWHIIDAGDRLEMLCKLISAIFVETFREMHKQGLIHPESPIKNIGMIAGLTALGKDENCIPDHQMKWFDRIVGMCRHGGVDIVLTPEEVGEQELIEKYLSKNPVVYDAVDDIEEWKNPEDDRDLILRGYDKIIRDYLALKPNHKLGGQRYDITKMSKSQKQQFERGCYMY